MANVYQAEDSTTGQVVALKVMSRDLETDPEYRARFIREARMLQGLRNNNIVRVYDAGEEAGRPYFSMEYLQGEDLEQKIRRDGPLGWREALEYMRQALSGLGAAWAAGLIHRDIKPENLFITGGVVKVMDFGVARPLTADGFQTQQGMVVGTPAYIAPEQAMGKKVDLRADLYSLGATFFHVMSGRTPYGEGQPSHLCASHVYDPYPSIADFVPDLPQGVVDLVARLAEKDPSRRGDQVTTLATINQLLGHAPDTAESRAEGPCLVIEAGRGLGTVAALPDGELVIGRMPGCGLTLDDARTSRRHASVSRRGTTLEVRDLGSRNGVLVNNRPVQSSPLKDGDRVTIGDTVLRVQLSPPVAPPPLSVTVGPAVVLPPGVAGPPSPLSLGSPGMVPAPPDALRTPSPQGMVAPPRALSPVPAASAVPQEVEHRREDQATFERLGSSPSAPPLLPRHGVLLSRLAKAVARARSPDEAARLGLEALAGVIPVDRGYVLANRGQAQAGREPWVPVASRDGAGMTPRGLPNPALVRSVRESGQSVLTVDVLTEVSLSADNTGSPMARVVMCAPMWSGEEALGALYLDRPVSRPFTVEELTGLEVAADLLGELLGHLLAAARNESFTRMVEDLGRSLSPEGRADLMGRTEREMGAILTQRQVNAAILCCDIRDFNVLAERLRPQEVAALLAQFLGVVTDAVNAERGAVVRFLGEGLVAVFGAPLAVENASLSAVKAGMAVIQGVLGLHRALPPDRRFACRVGVNTGLVVAGPLGTPRRLDYGVVGEVVAVADRLNKQANPMAMLVGEQTHRDLGGQVPTVPRGGMAVRGKATAMNVYEVVVPGVVRAGP
jgi:class 3 adenylate cyclase